MNSNSAGEEALNYLVQGKRHLLIKDYYSAVQAFEKVCQLLDAKYGKGADECGDVYLQYGIALLELARQETGARDGVVNAKIEDPSSAEDSEDEESQESPDNNDNKIDEDDDEEKKTENDERSQDEDESERKTDVEEDITENSDAEKENDNEENSTNKENENQPCDPSQPGSSTSKTEEDPPSNIEISWEVLWTAKQIFERQLSSGKPVELKLAEALQKLGEIFIEWESNDHAIDVLNKSLDLRNKALPDDDRLLAETYYHLGNAHSFISQIDKANECFQCAIDVILKRIENKKKIIAESSDNEEKSALDTEIKSLEDLLPDMRSRIEDKQDQMANTKEALRLEEDEKKMEEEVAAKIRQIEEKPINTINHLVKRKNTSPENENRKKLCSENGTTKINKGKNLTTVQ